MVQKLENAPVTIIYGTSDAYCLLRHIAMHRLGIGTTNDMKSVITGIFLPSLMSRDDIFWEKNIWREKVQSGISSIWDEIILTDLSCEIQNMRSLSILL